MKPTKGQKAKIVDDTKLYFLLGKLIPHVTTTKGLVILQMIHEELQNLKVYPF